MRLKATIAALLLLAPHAQGEPADPLQAAIASRARSPQFVARDTYRHPLEELRFLGVRPDATVIEIWPGARYWSEILAPYLAASGTYDTPVEAGPGWDKYASTFTDRVYREPALFGHVHITRMGAGHDDIAPPDSADFVLDTRNFHNWMEIGDVGEMLADIRRALKPGGILVIEDHRAHSTAPQDTQARNGYVRQDYVIDTIKAAGFEFVAASEALANPRDTADWPHGVWTLPPTLALGNTDRAKYLAIGEADNMLLKFRKPLR